MFQAIQEQTDDYSPFRSTNAWIFAYDPQEIA